LLIGGGVSGGHPLAKPNPATSAEEVEVCVGAEGKSCTTHPSIRIMVWPIW